MILIYTDKLNPRIEYIFKLVFTTILGKEIKFTTKTNKFITSTLPKLNYSYEKFGTEIYVKPHRLLHCRALIKPRIEPVRYNGDKYFFESSSDSILPFDLFAASFYLVTRYEEYLDFRKDKYKRFPASESILEEYGLLKKPVVNIWARMLAEKMKERYPELEFPEPAFHFLPTIDVDNAWAYAHKGVARSLGAIVKAAYKGNYGEMRERMRVWLGKEKDPYDTYNFIDEVIKGREDKVIFFFLLGNYKRYDRNLSWDNKHLRKLISRISESRQVGIHPSYSSSRKKNKKLLEEEIRRLKMITGNDVTQSRQHYLRLRLPRVYRNLIRNGITADYSMGYPSKPGFRAGICTPFPFYDLKKEAETTLMVYPFQIMDVTLRDYRKLSPEESMQEIETLMEEVRNVGGTFSYIWHNETLSDKNSWTGYREVFRKMNEIGFEWDETKKEPKVADTQ